MKHWWHHLLHNQSALTLKAALLFKPRLVTTSVPFHLKTVTRGFATRTQRTHEGTEVPHMFLRVPHGGSSRGFADDGSSLASL